MLLCRQHQVLTIADEVMTGFYRTGKKFGHQHFSTRPDILCVAKGLTGGTLPLAATICTDFIYEAFYSTDKSKALLHGHTFTGNGLGCAAALASLELLEGAETLEQIAMIENSHGEFVKSRGPHPALKDLACMGTLLRLELSATETNYFHQKSDFLRQFFQQKNLLIRPLGNVLYIIPPYCSQKSDLAKVYTAFEEVLELWI
jgi:adenosylmethionine-8-amino-7-oxononanoate aminotransferase